LKGGRSGGLSNWTKVLDKRPISISFDAALGSWSGQAASRTAFERRTSLGEAGGAQEKQNKKIEWDGRNE
jgi:hypothetical protein